MNPKQRETDLGKLRAENQRLRRSVQELSVLNDVAVAISSARSLNTIIELIVDRCVKHFAVEQAAVMLLERADKEAAFYTVVRRADQTRVRLPYRLDSQLTGWMLRYRKPLLINDLSADERFSATRAADCPIHSLLTVPLFLKGQMLGLIGLFNKRDAAGFSENDQRLLSILATESAQVIENGRLYEEERELERLQAELRAAAHIQKNLLPAQVPKIPGYDVAAINLPARTVSGDYFDFIPLSDSRLAFCLGDVSGKGMPAALLMANLQATLRGQVLLGLKPSECLQNTNYLIWKSTTPEKFATLFLSVLDFKNHRLIYSNAGHDAPYFLKGNKTTRLQAGGIVLGFLESSAYKQASLDFAPGNVLVVYSDGITEATNLKDEQFGEARLLQAISSALSGTAEEILHAILQAVDAFKGMQEQADDITLMVLKREA